MLHRKLVDQFKTIYFEFVFQAKTTNMAYIKYLLLLVLPVTFFLNVAYNNKTEFEQDPNYMYLFNGLNLTTHPGHIATYTQGTTAVELSSVIMRAAHLFRNTDDNFATDVLKNPQLYIKIVVRTFGILICLILIFSGLFILKMTNELIYCFIFQAVPAFSGSVIPWSFESFSAEPILLASVMIFVLIILWKFYFNKSFGESIVSFNGRKIIIDRFSIIIGIMTGFCLATKINTLPLLLLPLLLIQKNRDKFQFLIIAGISYIFFTLPVAHLYKLTLAWYASVFFHTGIYGEGSEGIINPETFIQNLRKFISGETVIVFVILVSLLFLAIQAIRRKFDISFKILACLTIVQLANVVLVLKHFYLYYFIPILPTLAVNIFLISQSFKTMKIWRDALIISFILGSLYLNKDLGKRVSHLYETENPVDGINIFSYQSTSPLYALKLGDDNSRNANSQSLKELYGDQYFYDIWNKIIITWNDTLSIDSLLKHNEKVYLHALDQYMQELPPPFEIKFLNEGTYLVKNPYLTPPSTSHLK